jgi:hypothetical protein
MTRSTVVEATVDSAKVVGLSVRNGAVTTRVIAQIKLILQQRHVTATGARVVNFPVAIRLGVLIEDELLHVKNSSSRRGSE